MAKYFLQQGPELSNPYEENGLLRSYLQQKLPAEMLHEIEPDLENIGNRAVTDLLEMGNDAEAHPPQLKNYAPWGERIDHIEVSQGWEYLAKAACEEGLVAIPYEQKYGGFSRLYQFAKLFLFGPSSAIFTCPVAMSDGAAKLIQLYGDDALKNFALRKLTSRNPAEVWYSGQWMTEKTGGSDVGNIETIARYENGTYRLYGEKWFCSAATSEMALALARIEDENGKTIPGSRGVSVFYLETKDENGKPNHLFIDKLKDKMASRALPTAEITLAGTPAKLVGSPGKGVKTIASLFNMTRTHNAIAASALMHRMNVLVKDYSGKRTAFGKKLIDLPLHVQTLANMETEFYGAFHIAFKMAEFLGKEEARKSNSDEQALLRLLMPLAKLYTAKQNNHLTAEGIECFGGMGIIEETGLARWYRDVIAYSIWEGSTNVLCLDALRAINKEQAFLPYVEDVNSRLGSVRLPILEKEQEKVRYSLSEVQQFMSTIVQEGKHFAEAGARGLAYSLSRIYIASLLIEHADYMATQNDRRGIIAARHWCKKDLTPLVTPSVQNRGDLHALITGQNIQVEVEKSAMHLRRVISYQ